MSEIEHEGKTYILKSQVESIVKERVSKVAQKATDAEVRLQEVTKELETFKSKQASYDVLAEQVSQLKGDLQASEKRYTRFQSMTSHCITEPELIEASEWQYEKNMKGKKQSEQVSLDDWLKSHIDNPDEAPLTIRPHLQGLSQDVHIEAGQEDVEEISEDTFDDISEPIYNQPPRANRGAVPTPEGKDILKRTVNDQDFYTANHEAIRKAWNSRYGR